MARRYIKEWRFLTAREVSTIQMNVQDLEARLKAQVDFPSPSKVATDIIALARDPEIEMAKVAQAVGRDLPADYAA